MPLSEIAQALVRRGVVTHDAAARAEQRRQLYGGGLDTALLELHLCDEATLLARLSEIIGIPLVPSPLLALPPGPTPKPAIDATTAQKLGVAPFAAHNDVLDVWVRPEHDHDGLVAWSRSHALLVEPFLISEVRFRALLRAIYGVALPPRYLSLLVSLIGTTAARRALGEPPELPTPTPVALGVDPVDTFVAAARLGDERTRRAALRHLSCRLGDPRVAALRRGFEKKASDSDPAVARAALHALTCLRDKAAIPVIIDLLDAGNEAIVAGAQASLVALTCADFGRKRKRWLEWWAEMGGRTRIEWLLEGLAHKTAEIRLLASNELYEVCGEYFGYHYDLPEREREEARQRWIAWWQSRTGQRGAAGKR